MRVCASNSGYLCGGQFLGSDLTIVLGSSLRVEPAAGLAFKAKLRTRVRDGVAAPRAVIVNLQPTPRDDQADLIIRARCARARHAAAAAACTCAM